MNEQKKEQCYHFPLTLTEGTIYLPAMKRPAGHAFKPSTIGEHHERDVDAKADDDWP